MTKDEGIKALTQYTPKGMSPKVFLTMLVNTFGVNPKTQKMWPLEVYVMMGYTCTRLQLDPFAKQVFFLPFWDTRKQDWQITTVVSIDGMRLVAQRSGLYAGQDDVSYDTEDGDNPNRASSTVYKLNKKTGDRMPTTATARWNEYVKKNKEGSVTGQWRDRPWLMLGKCAEALALRKAFPQELSGVYAEEEIDRSRDEVRDSLAQLPAKAKQELKPDKQKENEELPTIQVDPIEVAKAAPGKKREQIEAQEKVDPSDILF